MVFESLLFAIVVLPLFVALLCVLYFVEFVLWLVLPKSKFNKVVDWVKKLKEKFEDGNV